MRILGIETSCDETAAAVVEDGTKVISSAIASSKELHEKTGGIVPEIAARKQVESITPVLNEVIAKASSISPRANSLGETKLRPFTDCFDAIAVTTGPGLIGSLVVGVEAAKALSLALNKPLIPVNHLIGHIYANWIETSGRSQGVAALSLDKRDPLAEFPNLPAVVLIVSGGHTDLVLMKDHGKFKYLGGTLDDAAGEAFDKTARLLGIKKYLGGAELSKVASSCESSSIELPRPKIKDKDFDFSFSGLKTAVMRKVEEGGINKEEIAFEFENAVVDVLVDKTIRAVKENKVKSILLGGGVSANTKLREKMVEEAEKIDTKTHIPPINLCTDNAIYIASAAYFNNNPKPIDKIHANPSLGIMDNA